MEVFEDAFTELQAELMGACMEFLGEPVDKVYAYLYQEPCMLTTNFFSGRTVRSIATVRSGTGIN